MQLFKEKKLKPKKQISLEEDLPKPEKPAPVVKASAVAEAAQISEGEDDEDLF